MTCEAALKVAKPILFNTDMVRAIQDKRKTVTRRILFPNNYLREFRCKEYPNGWWFRGRAAKSWENIIHAVKREYKPKYKVGDILYVRETWTKGCIIGNGKSYCVSQGERSDVIFKEDCQRNHIAIDDVIWKPSIHMPKWAARIFLRVTDVRVERLQDIKIADIISEGIAEMCRECFENYGNGFQCCVGENDECHIYDDTMSNWQDLWNETVKKSNLDKYGWAANPWVWVIEFERLEVEI